MVWIFVAISAYLLLAIANLLDKFLVDNVLKNSRAYAFVACVLASFLLLVTPWYLSWPGTYLALFNLVIGAVFAGALWSLYEALRRGEAARVLVFIGGATPIFSLIISLLLFQEKFSANQWWGMICLFIGLVIIAFLPIDRSYLSRLVHKFRLQFLIESGGLKIALLAAFLYSVYFIGTKYAYNTQPFASVFLWNRLGSLLFVLMFLFNKKDRQAIVNNFRRSAPKKNKYLVFIGQSFGSLGFVLQSYAIFLGSVVLVNALQGVQYAFLLLISTGLALISPRLLKESFSWRLFLQKTAAVIIIAAGLYFIIA